MHYHENRLSDLRNETRGLHNYIRKWKFLFIFSIHNLHNFHKRQFHNMSSESLSNRENLSDNYSSWNDYYGRTRTGATGQERSRRPSTNTSFTSGGGRTRIPSGGRSAGAYSTPYSSSSSYMPNYSTRRRI